MATAASSGCRVSGVSIWVRPEPFILGVFPVAPHAKLAVKTRYRRKFQQSANLQNGFKDCFWQNTKRLSDFARNQFIKRIIPYAQTKGQLGFPKLSYSVWKHIACNKLQLPETVAWMLFSTCRTLHRGRQETRIQWDCHYAKRTAIHERDHLKSLTTVDTLKFVLLLYIQLFNRITLRSTAVSPLSTEEWPSFDQSIESVNRSTSRRALKVLDEHYHLVFVGRKLCEIIDLIDEKDQTEIGTERFISLEIMEALSFLIEGSMDGNKTVVSLHDMLLSPALRCKVGFSNSRKAFSYHSVVTWIKRNLCPYPYGVSSCLAIGKNIPIGGDLLENSHNKSGYMMANTASGPKGHKFLVLTRFSKQTIAKSAESLKGVSVRIHRCHSSYIYLLVPLKSVVITKCRDTTIVLGPVATTVMIAVCKNLRVIAICRRITISDCQASSLHLLTPSQPVLLGNRNENLILAPFHTTYAKIEDHMLESGIGQALNLWDSPVCLSDDGNLETQSCWSLLPPEDFYIFNIPFEMEGNTKKIPGNPVPVYQNALKEKKQQVEAWHHLVKSANLGREQRDQLNKLVRARFQTWLVLNSHQRELDGLAALTPNNSNLKLKSKSKDAEIDAYASK